MSVQYCLCVSRISVHSVQCQSIASAQFYSVQCKQCSESVQFLKHSVYTVVCSIQSMVFSVSWVTVYGVHGLPTIIQCRQCSVQYSVVSGDESLKRSVSVQCLQRSGCVLFSGSFSVCTLQLSAVFRTLAVHQECHVHVMFRVHTLNVLCPCAVLEFEHPVNHRGSPEDKIQCKMIIF